MIKLRKLKKPRALVILDEIMDEIDRLHEIKNPKARAAGARALIDYIELHHNPPRSY
jgi:hypothetical protein